MTSETYATSILLIAIALVMAKLIRIRFRFFSKYFLPSSVIAGVLLLFAGPEVLGHVFVNTGAWGHRDHGILTEDLVEVFRALPGLLISVIFASLFLGKNIPNIKRIWNIAGPQVAFGQTVAWGQYVFGLLVALLVLVPFFDANPMTGALIEIAFEGGHGTSAGLAATFAELGFEEGADLAIGLATVGVVSGVILGVILINWGVRRGKTNFLKADEEFSETELRGIVDPEDREKSGLLTTSPQSIEPLTLHVGLIGVAIVVGLGIQQGLIALENATWGAGGEVKVMAYIPLFPLAMIGGVVLQVFLERYDRYRLVDRDTVIRIQGLALDFLIVGAIAGLSLRVIGQNFAVFVILALTGIVWNLAAFLALAPRMIPKNWFERGIGDFGQSMGMTAAGLMLIRIVDSKGDTRALEAFGYKQLLFEPFVGGGLMTALSVPLIYQLGPVPVLVFSLVVWLAWLGVGLLYFGRMDASAIE